MSNQQRITAIEISWDNFDKITKNVFKHSNKIFKRPFTLFKLNFKNNNKCISIISHKFKMLLNKPMLL